MTDGADAVGDRGVRTVDEQLRRCQPTDDAIAMRAEFELQFCAKRGARWCPVELDRLARTTRHRIAVQRPRDAFENRRLAGAVGADDAGESVLKFDQRVDVLTKVLQAQRAQLHGASYSGSAKALSSPGSGVMVAGSLTRCR